MPYSPWENYGKVKVSNGFDQVNMGAAEQQYNLNQNRGVYKNSRAEKSKDGRSGAMGGAARSNAAGASDAAFAKRVGEGDTAGQDFWNGVSGTYANNGPGYVKTAHESFAPNVDPNMEGYYDQAFKQAAGGINKQLASRGMYGSSEGLNLISRAGTTLAADRAQREADYALRRQQQFTESAKSASNDENQWVTSLGNLAFGAGAEDRAYRNLVLDASSTQQQMEDGHNAQDFNENMSLDQFRLAQGGAAVGDAGTAQGFGIQRSQNYFNNTLNAGNSITGAYNPMFFSDYDAAQGQAGMTLGKATDMYNIDKAQSDSNYMQYMNAMNQMGGTMGNQYGAKGVK